MKGHAWIQRAGGGGGAAGPCPPLEKSQKYRFGFRSNTGPNPLKITELSSQHSMLGYHRHASETPFNHKYIGLGFVAKLVRIP